MKILINLTKALQRGASIISLCFGVLITVIFIAVFSENIIFFIVLISCFAFPLFIFTLQILANGFKQQNDAYFQTEYYRLQKAKIDAKFKIAENRPEHVCNVHKSSYTSHILYLEMLEQSEKYKEENEQKPFNHIHKVRERSFHKRKNQIKLDLSNIDMMQ